MPRLTPTEIARETGMQRREVIAFCMEHGVEIWQGRIDLEEFRHASESTARSSEVVQYTLLDSTGNLIASFEDQSAARSMLDQIVADDPGSAGDVALIAYDASGHPVGDPVTAPSRVRA